MHRDAARLMRAQGNHAGRGRMRSDGTLRPAKPPRGLILGTGEDLPAGQSLHARMEIVEVLQGDIPGAKLTKCQADAKAGLYAQATSSFIRWLAPRLDEVRREFFESVAKLRIQYQHKHPRTNDIRAQLTATYAVFVDFLLDTQVMDKDEADEFKGRIDRGLKQAADAQEKFGQSQDPCVRFAELLSSAISSGDAHVAARQGTAPHGCETAWGWRPAEQYAGWRPQGVRVGWLDGDDLYLDLAASYRAAQKMAADGTGVEVSSSTLPRRLREAGVLLSTDKARQTLTVRRQIEGRQHEVLHVRAQYLSSSVDDEEAEISRRAAMDAAGGEDELFQ
jgi:hypothetical protein